MPRLRPPFGHLTPLTYYILANLAVRERSAYDLCQRISRDSSGSVVPTPATMHHALKNLIELGYIKPLPLASQTEPRSYRLTPAGQINFKAELKRLERATLIGRLAATAAAPTSPELPPLPELAV